MATTYDQVKAAVIDVIDDFTKKDVTANYAPNGDKLYDAKTTLESLKINGPIRASMPHRFNKAIAPLCKTWKNTGTLEMVGLKTIGDAITLACALGRVSIPKGEPT